MNLSAHGLVSHGGADDSQMGSEYIETHLSSACYTRLRIILTSENHRELRWSWVLAGLNKGRLEWVGRIVELKERRYREP